MHLDVQDLRNFYYRSALGRGAQKVIRDDLVKREKSRDGSQSNTSE